MNEKTGYSQYVSTKIGTIGDMTASSEKKLTIFTPPCITLFLIHGFTPMQMAGIFSLTV